MSAFCSCSDWNIRWILIRVLISESTYASATEGCGEGGITLSHLIRNTHEEISEKKYDMKNSHSFFCSLFYYFYSFILYLFYITRFVFGISATFCRWMGLCTCVQNYLFLSFYSFLLFIYLIIYSFIHSFIHSFISIENYICQWIALSCFVRTSLKLYLLLIFRDKLYKNDPSLGSDHECRNERNQVIAHIFLRALNGAAVYPVEISFNCPALHNIYYWHSVAKANANMHGERLL